MTKYQFLWKEIHYCHKKLILVTRNQFLWQEIISCHIKQQQSPQKYQNVEHHIKEGGQGAGASTEAFGGGGMQEPLVGAGDAGADQQVTACWSFNETCRITKLSPHFISAYVRGYWISEINPFLGGWGTGGGGGAPIYLDWLLL